MSGLYRRRAANDERRTAARLTKATGVPFERVPLSGRDKRLGKGDLRSISDDPLLCWLVEMKNRAVTNARGEKKVELLLEELEKIASEAESADRLPALLYRYTGSRSVWAVVELGVLERVLKAYADLKEQWNSTNPSRSSTRSRRSSTPTPTSPSRARMRTNAKPPTTSSKTSRTSSRTSSKV